MNHSKLSFVRVGIFTALTATSLFSASFAKADLSPTRWPSYNNPNGFNIPKWHPTNYTDRFDQLPIAGSVDNDHIPWADSFWPKNRGGAAYPWHKYSNLDFSQDLTAEQAKAIFFDAPFPSVAEIKNMSREELANLSPSMKYDIYTGNYKKFPMTSKFLGKKFVLSHKAVGSPYNDYWGGYCYAWTAVSLEYREPLPYDAPAIVDGKPIVIPFGSGDIKALIVANYVESSGGVPQIGQHCYKRFTFPAVIKKNGKETFDLYADTDGLLEKDYPEYLRQFQSDAKRLGYVMPKEDSQQKNHPDINSPTFVNDLVRDLANSPECNDTDAGAFHIVMGNQIGLMKEGIAIDKTRDLEVWNQPVFKYRSSIVPNEDNLPPSADSVPGTSSRVHVKTTIYYADDTDFAWAFWYPTLTNLFSLDKPFLDEYAVYQQKLTNEGKQDGALPYPQNLIDTSHYEYYLNLDANRRIIGGQWITFDRPDYLWISPKSPFVDDYSRLAEIYKPFTVSSSTKMIVDLDEEK